MSHGRRLAYAAMIAGALIVLGGCGGAVLVAKPLGNRAAAEPSGVATASVIVDRRGRRWTLEWQSSGRILVDGVHRVTIEPDGDIIAVGATEPSARYREGVVAPAIHGNRYHVDRDAVVRDEEGIVFRFDPDGVLYVLGHDRAKAAFRYRADPAFRRSLAIALCGAILADAAYGMW